MSKFQVKYFPLRPEGFSVHQVSGKVKGPPFDEGFWANESDLDRTPLIIYTIRLTSCWISCPTESFVDCVLKEATV